MLLLPAAAAPALLLPLPLLHLCPAAAPAAAAPPLLPPLLLPPLTPVTVTMPSASLHSDDDGHAQLRNPPGRLAGAFLLLLPLCAGPAAFSAAASPLKLVVLLPLLSP